MTRVDAAEALVAGLGVLELAVALLDPLDDLGVLGGRAELVGLGLEGRLGGRAAARPRPTASLWSAPASRRTSCAPWLAAWRSAAPKRSLRRAAVGVEPDAVAAG